MWLKLNLKQKKINILKVKVTENSISIRKQNKNTTSARIKQNSNA